MRIVDDKLKAIMDKYRLENSNSISNKNEDQSSEDVIKRCTDPVTPVKLTFIGKPSKEYYRKGKGIRTRAERELERRKKAEIEQKKKEINKQEKQPINTEQIRLFKKYGSFGTVIDGKFVREKHKILHLHDSNVRVVRKMSVEKKKEIAKAKIENRKTRAIESNIRSKELSELLKTIRSYREVNDLDGVDRGALK